MHDTRCDWHNPHWWSCASNLLKVMQHITASSRRSPGSKSSGSKVNEAKWISQMAPLSGHNLANIMLSNFWCLRTITLISGWTASWHPPPPELPWAFHVGQRQLPIYLKHFQPGAGGRRVLPYLDDGLWHGSIYEQVIWNTSTFTYVHYSTHNVHEVHCS